jgi:hypothetical protein
MQICEGSSLMLPDGNAGLVMFFDCRTGQCVALQQLLLSSSAEHVLYG